MFFKSRMARSMVLIFVFGLALIIRLYDLTDLPLDFHPTRQLLSVIKARGLFFQTQPDGYSTRELEAGIHYAEMKDDLEPVVFERLVAFTYQFIGEKIWVARIYTSIFWLGGGVFLFMLVRDLVSFEGALVSTAYYLLLPYAVIASRSFQPDPLMVALTIAFWWMFSRWMSISTNPSAGKKAGMLTALLAGLLGGFAIFIKFPAAFFVIGGALGLLLPLYTFRELFRNVQIWIMAVVGLLPALGYLIYGVLIKGYLIEKFGGNFVPALLVNPLNYLHWEVNASLAAGGLFIMLGLLGFFFAKDRQFRSFLLGLWGMYFGFGLYFNYHAGTHDYYHLPLIPIVAVSLGWLGDAVFVRLSEATVQRWARSVVYVILIYGALSVTWDIRDQMKAVDYRPEAAMWAEIGEKLAYEPTAMALTQDYGSRLEYFGGTSVGIWPSVDDLSYRKVRTGESAFEVVFKKWIRNKSFFLVTDFAELKKQPELKAYLATYPVYAEGEGYIIYQLRELK